VWNPPAFRPEIKNRLFVACITAFASLGAGACGPSGGGNTATYLVTFALSVTPEDLSQLAFKVTYTADGDFVGTGTTVSCELIPALEDATADFNDDDDSTLEVDIDAPEDAMKAATELVECRFSSSDQPTTNEFTVAVVSATDDFGEAVAPNDVKVVVSSIDVDDSATLIVEIGE
jgi:hypothetical protein